MDAKKNHEKKPGETKPNDPLPGQGALPGTGATDVPAADPTEKLTQTQLDKLGNDFMNAQNECERVEALVAGARDKKSEAVTAIVSALGHKGPYTIGGRTWMATKVKGQGEGGLKFTMREVASSKVTLGS